MDFSDIISLQNSQLLQPEKYPQGGEKKPGSFMSKMYLHFGSF